MPRNMSFSMTTQQVRDRTKDVTRRFGWWFLKPGDRICAVEKAMGLKAGEKVVRLAMIEVVSVRSEPLGQITADDCEREGFPEFSPAEFVGMLERKFRCKASDTVNRIEFRYLDDAP